MAFETTIMRSVGLSLYKVKQITFNSHRNNVVYFDCYTKKKTHTKKNYLTIHTLKTIFVDKTRTRCHFAQAGRNWYWKIMNANKFMPLSWLFVLTMMLTIHNNWKQLSLIKPGPDVILHKLAGIDIENSWMQISSCLYLDCLYWQLMGVIWQWHKISKTTLTPRYDESLLYFNFLNILKQVSLYSVHCFFNFMWLNKLVIQKCS